MKNFKVNSNLLITGGNIVLPENHNDDDMIINPSTQNDQITKSRLIDEIRAKTHYTNNDS